MFVQTTNQNALVELGVNAHILSAHLLRCELLDLLDRTTGAILEANAVNTLVHVDRVLSCHDLHKQQPCLYIHLNQQHTSFSVLFLPLPSFFLPPLFFTIVTVPLLICLKSTVSAQLTYPGKTSKK